MVSVPLLYKGIVLQNRLSTTKHKIQCSHIYLKTFLPFPFFALVLYMQVAGPLHWNTF